MRLVLFAFILVLTGCISTHPPLPQSAVSGHSDTMEIIRTAAESAPNGVQGEYVLSIKAAGSQGRFVYLNTELDYRDQRSVTIAIHPSIVPEFVARYGSPPQDYFINKTISVSGQAKRTRINLSSNGRPTGKYYYQTHIRVMEISQIKVISVQA